MGLGMPVKQSIVSCDISKTLRLKHGRWESATSPLSAVWRKWRQRQGTICMPSIRPDRRWPSVKLVVTLSAIVLVGAGLGAGYSHWSAPSLATTALPIAPASTNVYVSDQPFAADSAPLINITRTDTPASPQAIAGAPSVPALDLPIGLPIASPSMSVQGGGVTQRPSATAPVSRERVAAIQEGRLTDSPPQIAINSVGPNRPQTRELPTGTPQRSAVQTENRPIQAGVLFDDNSIAQAPVAITQPTAPQSQPSAATRPQAAAPVRSAATLVAIAPDGNSAVFTNPQTRLPQQFRVGDKLHTGEVITTINASDGKVTTNSREYSLE